MNNKDQEYKKIPRKAVNPYKAPEGYFETLENSVMEKIRNSELDAPKEVRRISLRPYLSLAASISGLALVVYIVLQSLNLNINRDRESINLSLLESTGIIFDEASLVESYYAEDENSYTEWEEDAITYLASNEMDLLFILESN